MRWDEVRQWVEAETDLATAVFSGGRIGSLPGEVRDSFVVARHFGARRVTVSYS